MEKASDDESLDDSHTDDGSEEGPEFVEMDPSGRYGRYKEVLGKGAHKTVYKAFDDLDGIEVAWNQVNIHDVLYHAGDIERLYSELHLLKTLKHNNIIKFYTSWVDMRNRNVNFITEIFTSGTLRQFRKKHQHVKLRAIKNWARQILMGLVFLHSQNPPIVHRDLKCDNVFINGNTGEVKIGDLGLATIMHQAPAAQSVIGTPEFMAPELYEEHYNELVDVYSFGMCLLEMLTSEYPYSECTNAAQIYRKVTTGKKPAALGKIKDGKTREFVEKCLASASHRLHARELLMDPFLCTEEDSEMQETTVCVSLNSNGALQGLDPIPEHTYLRSADRRHCEIDGRNHSKNEWCSVPDLSSYRPVLLHSTSPKKGLKSCMDFRIKGRKQDDKKVLVRIRIANSGGEVRIIQFDFDVDADTAMSVASEMVAELDLFEQDATTIAEMIDAEIMALLPDWKPGLSFDDTIDDDVGRELKGPLLDTPYLQDESDELQLTAPVIAVDTSEDSQLAAGSTYGRFEEVGCNVVSLDSHEQDSDGMELFSDYSDDAESDFSMDGLSRSDSGADHDMNNQSLKLFETMSKMDSLPSSDGKQTVVNKRNTEEERTVKVGDENLDDSELVRLVMQQQKEPQTLHVRHDESLACLRTLLSQEPTRTRDNTLPTDTTMCDISGEVLRLSGEQDASHRHWASEVCVHVTEAACSRINDSNVPPAAIDESEGASFNSVAKVESTLTDSASIVDNSKDGHDIIPVKMPGAMLKECLTIERANVCGEGKLAAVNKVSAIIDDKFKGAPDNIFVAGMAETIFNDFNKGSHVLNATAESAISVNRPKPSINEDVKSSFTNIAKRESYLELYKASSSKDKSSSSKLSESHHTADGNSQDVNQEQLKKMADFADKLINNLTQSNNKYVGTSSVKRVTLQNGQQGGSAKSHSETPIQGGQHPAVAISSVSGVFNSQHSAGVRTIASVSNQNLQQGGLGKNQTVFEAQNSSVFNLSNAGTLNEGLWMKGGVPASEHGAAEGCISGAVAQNGQQTTLSMSHFSSSVHMANQGIATSCRSATFPSGASGKSVTSGNT